MLFSVVFGIGISYMTRSYDTITTGDDECEHFVINSQHTNS